MSVVRVEDIGDASLERLNKLLAGIPDGAIKAAHGALKRAGAAAKTGAGRYAAKEYAIKKSDFMSNVTVSTKIDAAGGSGGRMIAGLNIRFAGHVLPLLTFNTKFTRGGRLTTQVMRNGGSHTLQHAFAERVFGKMAVFERVGADRFPVRQLFGPSTAHMMQNEEVVKMMGDTVVDTYEKRIEHEISRLLNGWGR